MEFFIIYAILFAIATATIAGSKNRNPALWGLLGAAIGIFALIMVIAMPAEKA